MPRQKRKFGTRRTRPVFVVACEDSQSGPSYFKALFRLYADSVALKEPPKHTANKTAPDQVVQRAVACRKKLDSSDVRDQAWAVFDADPQAGEHRKEEISKTKACAVRESINTAISNPCFEHWIHLHLEDADGAHDSANAMVQALGKAWRKRFGTEYDKGSTVYNRLVTRESVAAATERAERQHNCQDGASPELCSPCVTDVYKLVQAIEAVASPADVAQ